MEDYETQILRDYPKLAKLKGIKEKLQVFERELIRVCNFYGR